MSPGSPFGHELDGEPFLRAYRRYVHAMIALAVVGALCVVVSLGLILALLVRLNELGEQNRALNRRVAECTTKGGRCYEEGAARTAEAVRILNEVTIAVAACDDDRRTAAQIRSCVQAALRSEPRPVSP